MTLGAGKVSKQREQSVGGGVTSIGRGFTMTPITKKRAGMTGSQILRGIDTEIETRIKKEIENPGKKGTGTKRGRDFPIMIRTLKANPRERVEILKKRMGPKVMSELMTRKERRVGTGTENETGITKTETTVIAAKAKGRSHKGLLAKTLNQQGRTQIKIVLQLCKMRLGIIVPSICSLSFLYSMLVLCRNKSGLAPACISIIHFPLQFEDLEVELFEILHCLYSQNFKSFLLICNKGHVKFLVKFGFSHNTCFRW